MSEKMRSKENCIYVSGGNFHYSIRAGTYGDRYDEAPWKILYGVEKYWSRNPFVRSSAIHSYSPKVLIGSWVEDRLDRQYIKKDRSPISQFNHFYKTTYSSSFASSDGHGKKGRKDCQSHKEKEKISNGNKIKAFPGHQQTDLTDLSIRARVGSISSQSQIKPEFCVQNQQQQ